MDNRAIPVASSLHPLAVDARGPRCREATLSCLLPAIIVDVLQVKGVEVSRKVAVERGVSVYPKSQWTAER